MEKIKCPLCESKQRVKIDTINQKELISLYMKLTGEDFTYLITSDISFVECLNCSIKYFWPFITGDEKFYNSLQKFNWYYLNEKFEYQIAKNFVKKNNIVVDAGCGRGAFFQQIADLNIQFTGIETSNKAVEMAIRDNINVINSKIVDFSKANKDFADVVTSFQVCEHISELKEFIESKIKIVKSGGRMIIAVPSDDSFISNNVNGILNMPPHHISRWTDKVFHFIAKTYNLKLEKIIHEELQEHHHNFYLKNFMENKIIQYKMIDLSLKRLLASKFFFYISILASIFYKPKKDIYGHTVVAVFKKE